MTIIEPNKNKLKINLFLTALIAGVVLAVLANIYLYNATVDFRYRLSNQEKNLGELRVANADLKNALYKMLDIGNFGELAAKLGLIKELKPGYQSPYDKVASALR